MAQQQPARRKTQSSKTPVSIPDKLYFRIGDVSRLCSLPAYVLRFWETEFSQLKPNKGGTGQRLYRKRDVEMVLQIKHLLYDEGFTIAGARRLLTEKRRPLSDASQAFTVRPDAEQSGTVTQDRSGISKTTTAISKTTAASKSQPNPSKATNQPKIKELREEMRALLTLLGSDPRESKPLPVPTKRDGKKTRRVDEPTLF